MRGTDAGAPGRARRHSRRFIPAHAGNSAALRSREQYPPPRFIPAHAGNRQTQTGPVASRPRNGSSPRMRGTGARLGIYTPGNRFIPAYAGNSAPPMGRISPTTVHPRACGEQYGQWGSVGVDYGSSPRMRGTGCTGSGFERFSRFIPAHAGNRSTAPHTPRRPPVHPRACGEQSNLAGSVSIPYGSSPRMRGTENWEHRAAEYRRFIPAHAGNRARLG